MYFFLIFQYAYLNRIVWDNDDTADILAQALDLLQLAYHFQFRDLCAVVGRELGSLFNEKNATRILSTSLFLRQDALKSSIVNFIVQ